MNIAFLPIACSFSNDYLRNKCVIFKIKLKVVSLPTDVPNFDFMKTKILSGKPSAVNIFSAVRGSPYAVTTWNCPATVTAYRNIISSNIPTGKHDRNYPRQSLYLCTPVPTGIARTYMNCAPEYAKQKTLHRWSPHNANCWKTGYGNGNWQEYMALSPNPSTHTNVTYCFSN